MQVVVLMGGLGTRLKSYTKETPKPLVEVNGMPFFDYQFDLMRKAGFCKFLFLIGYRAQMIESYYGDGSKWNVSISYSYDGEELLGTGGAVRRAYDLLEDDFLLMYADSFMDIDFQETLYRYSIAKEQGKQALMTVLKNQNAYDKSNCIIENGQLLLYDKHHPTEQMNYIDYGIGIYQKQLFTNYQLHEKFDVAVIQNALSLHKQMAVHIVTKRFYEIGSPQSLAEFKEYSKQRFFEKHPAVFLDRDGVLNEIVYNEDTEQMDSPLKIEEVVFMDRAAEAIRLLRDKGYYVFIVTNQPAAAKGKVKLDRLYDINTYLIEQLKEQGALIDDLFMCPHYTRKLDLTKEDFLIENCECRKPKAGLLLKAGEKYQIDWEHSYMVGDSYTDVVAGQNANVKTVFLGGLKCDVCRHLNGKHPDYIVSNVYEAAYLCE